MNKEKADMIIYTAEDGLTKVETTFDGDTMWLSIDQMTELFQRDKSTISRHIKNIFTEHLLKEKSIEKPTLKLLFKFEFKISEYEKK